MSLSIFSFGPSCEPQGGEARPSSWPTSSSITRSESRNMGLLEDMQRQMGEKSRSKCPRLLLRPYCRSGGSARVGRCIGTEWAGALSALAPAPKPAMRCCKNSGDSERRSYIGQYASVHKTKALSLPAIKETHTDDIPGTLRGQAAAPAAGELLSRPALCAREGGDTVGWVAEVA